MHKFILPTGKERDRLHCIGLIDVKTISYATPVLWFKGKFSIDLHFTLVSSENVKSPLKGGSDAL